MGSTCPRTISCQRSSPCTAASSRTRRTRPSTSPLFLARGQVVARRTWSDPSPPATCVAGVRRRPSQAFSDAEQMADLQRVGRAGAAVLAGRPRRGVVPSRSGRRRGEPWRMTGRQPLRGLAATGCLPPAMRCSRTHRCRAWRSRRRLLASSRTPIDSHEAVARPVRARPGAPRSRRGSAAARGRSARREQRWRLHSIRVPSAWSRQLGQPRPASEIARIGGRTRIEGLSPSELSVATLVAEGRTNCDTRVGPVPRRTHRCRPPDPHLRQAQNPLPDRACSTRAAVLSNGSEQSRSVLRFPPCSRRGYRVRYAELPR